VIASVKAIQEDETENYWKKAKQKIIGSSGEVIGHVLATASPIQLLIFAP
jgi:hypothetical protein